MGDTKKWDDIIIKAASEMLESKWGKVRERIMAEQAPAREAKKQRWYMDAERLVTFCAAPDDVPERFHMQAYDILWQYWLEHYANGPTQADRAEYEKTRAELAAQHKGWVSQHDMMERGWTGERLPRRLVPKEIVDKVFAELIAKEPPC